MTPTLEHSHDDRFELIADRGTIRMILMGALNDANLWTRAVGASQETKNHWARRGNVIRALLEQMPAPANPRDPFEDLPGEPTPEEADAAHRARAAAEDVRRDAAKVATEKSIEAGMEWSTELEIAAAAGMLEPPDIRAHPDDLNSIFPHVDATPDDDLDGLLG